MALFGFHIRNHVDTEAILTKLDLIILKQNTMSEIGQQIKDLLLAASQKVDNIFADVLRLHAKIDALPSTPEFQEIKDMSTSLVTKLQAVDDATAEENPPPPPPEARGNSGRTIKG